MLSQWKVLAVGKQWLANIRGALSVANTAADECLYVAEVSKDIHFPTC